MSKDLVITVHIQDVDLDDIKPITEAMDAIFEKYETKSVNVVIRDDTRQLVPLPRRR